MRLLIPAVCCLVSLAACSVMPSAPQIPRPIDESCVTPCARLPMPDDGNGAIGSDEVWMHDVIKTAGECIRLHDRCNRATID